MSHTSLTERALVPVLGPGLCEVIAQTQAAVDAALLAHRI
jgi:hypothetical protein